MKSTFSKFSENTDSFGPRIDSEKHNTKVKNFTTHK